MTVPLQQLKGMQMSTHTRSEETATIRQRKIYERRTSVPFLSKVVHKRDQKGLDLETEPTRTNLCWVPTGRERAYS